MGLRWQGHLPTSGDAVAAVPGLSSSQFNQDEQQGEIRS